MKDKKNTGLNKKQKNKQHYYTTQAKKPQGRHVLSPNETRGSSQPRFKQETG